MERLRITYILEYLYGDPDVELQLSASLFNRCEDFRIMKQKKYAEEVDAEEIEAIEINPEYVFSDVTHEKAVKVWKERHGEYCYQRNYAIENTMRKEFRSTVALLSGSGDFFPQISIERSGRHHFYYLKISCESDYGTLKELGTFIAEAFQVIPRKQIIAEALSGNTSDLIKLNKFFRLAQDAGEPHDDTLAVFKKAINSDDAVIQEDVLSELWADVAYEKGMNAQALKQELIAMQQRLIKQQLPDDSVILNGLSDILAELNEKENN